MAAAISKEITYQQRIYIQTYQQRIYIQSKSDQGGKPARKQLDLG
jgi:hypothetical protein